MHKTRILLRTLAMVGVGAATLSAQATSTWVFFGEAQRLHYQTDTLGNRAPGRRRSAP